MTDHPGRAALAAIMAAAEKATPGPWDIIFYDDCVVLTHTPSDICEIVIDDFEDADFIATARNNIASVNALVASLEAENEMLREALCLPDADRRLMALSEMIATKGSFRRADLRRQFGISIPQASADIKRWLAASPGAATYNRSSKQYERAELAEAKAATEAAVMAERERCAAMGDQWSKTGDLLLRCGEMTAQELRTAKAVANGIAAAIRGGDTP